MGDKADVASLVGDPGSQALLLFQVYALGNLAVEGKSGGPGGLLKRLISGLQRQQLLPLQAQV